MLRIICFFVVTNKQFSCIEPLVSLSAVEPKESLLYLMFFALSSTMYLFVVKLCTSSWTAAAARPSTLLVIYFLIIITHDYYLFSQLHQITVQLPFYFFSVQKEELCGTYHQPLYVYQLLCKRSNWSNQRQQQLKLKLNQERQKKAFHIKSDMVWEQGAMII